MYSLLEDHIKQPKFLKQLEDAKEDTQEPGACAHGSEVLQEEWWDVPKGAASTGADSDEGYLEVHTHMKLTGTLVFLQKLVQHALLCQRCARDHALTT